MIDSAKKLPEYKKARDKALEELINEEQLSYAKDDGKWLYTTEKLNSFISQLPNFFTSDTEIATDSPRYEPV